MKHLVGILAVLTFAWVLAFWSYVWRFDDRQRFTPNRELPSTIDSLPPTVDARYVASTLDRNDRKRYHLPDCSYVRLLKHGRGFESEAEARAVGYEPCSRCLTPRIARVK